MSTNLKTLYLYIQFYPPSSAQLYTRETSRPPSHTVSTYTHTHSHRKNRATRRGGTREKGWKERERQAQHIHTHTYKSKVYHQSGGGGKERPERERASAHTPATRVLVLVCRGDDDDDGGYDDDSWQCSRLEPREKERARARPTVSAFLSIREPAESTSVRRDVFNREEVPLTLAQRTDIH